MLMRFPLRNSNQAFQTFPNPKSMSSLPIINKSYELYKVIIETNQGLSKRWKYGLGISLENSILDMLEQLLMAKNAPKPMKAGYLLKASSKLESSRLKARLMLELKLANETKLFQAQSQFEEIGRMLGGWLKSSQSQ
ncbi:MAG: hypothetical protein ACI9QC_000618 [Oceanicoccus sp.]